MKKGRREGKEEEGRGKMKERRRKRSQVSS